MVVKNKMLIPTILGGILLVGVLLGICGIGLSMGFETMSFIGFFGALAILILLRIVGWVHTGKHER